MPLLYINYIITPNSFTANEILRGIIVSLNNSIQSLQPEILAKKIVIKIEDIGSFSSKILVVLGKNALGYIPPLLTKYPGLFNQIIVFQARGYTSSEYSWENNVEVSFVDHPIPSIHNFEVTKHFLDTISLRKERCYFHFVITGGTSSCLVYPENTISMDQYIQTTEILLLDNIDIFSFNEMRSTIDATKGGKLSQLLENHTIDTNIISDVFTNNPSYVGSGPTVPGIVLRTSSRNKLLQIADKLGYKDQIHDLEKKLSETSKYRNENHSWNILASNQDFCDIVKKSIEENFIEFDTNIVTTELNQECNDFAESLFNEFNSMNSASIFIWGGELRSTINSQLHNNEKGGRLSLFAYYAAIKFSQTKGMDLIAFATDGKDGSSPQSCYHVNNKTYQALLSLSDSELSLQIYNMGELFNKIGYSLETELTNINYADIIILIKY